MGVDGLEELRDFYALHDGENLSVGVANGSILPGHQLLAIDQVVGDWRMLTGVWEKLTSADRDQFPGGYTTLIDDSPVAGTRAGAFLPAFIPIACWDDSYYFCDARSGEHSGCVRAFGPDGADDDGIAWPSITAMVTDIRTSIQQSTPADGWLPTITDGCVVWEADPDPDEVARERVGLRPIEVPFAEPVLPVASAAAEAIVDRDQLTAAVVAQADADHPGRRVRPLEMPRDDISSVPGLAVQCSVLVEDEAVAYTAFVTGQPDYFMCVRGPLQGWRIRYRPR